MNNALAFRHRSVRLLVSACSGALLLGLLATGCQRQPAHTGAATNPIAGVYQLASIDGKALPCTPPGHGGGVTIRSGSFTIEPDGTCRSHVAFTLPNGAESARDVAATYTRDGDRLRMQWKGAGVTEGEVAGDQFKMRNEGLEFVYRR